MEAFGGCGRAVEGAAVAHVDTRVQAQEHARPLGDERRVAPGRLAQSRRAKQPGLDEREL